jgi:hypothetical protein
MIKNEQAILELHQQTTSMRPSQNHCAIAGEAKMVEEALRRITMYQTLLNQIDPSRPPVARG